MSRAGTEKSMKMGVRKQQGCYELISTSSLISNPSVISLSHPFLVLLLRRSLCL